MTNLPQEPQKYTYDDYLKWDDDKRWELIDGYAYAMAAPNVAHQRTLRELSIAFGSHLRGKRCELFIAPFDVRLSPEKGDKTVVQPDLLVVCDPSKLSDGKSCKGAPDLVIEILSPSNTFHDKITKFKKYKEAGVLEVWFVNPVENYVEVYTRKGNIYDMDGYGQTEQITVGILPELTINLSEIFDEEENNGPKA